VRVAKSRVTDQTTTSREHASTRRATRSSCVETT